MKKKSIINSLAVIAVAASLHAQSLTMDTSADSYFQKGQIQYRAGMYDFAIFSLEKALEKNHAQYEAANILAEIFILKNNKQKAVEYYLASLESNAGQPDIHNALAELYEFFNDGEKAFDHYRKAVAADKKHIRANLNLVRFYLAMNKKELADRHFKTSADEGDTLTEKIFAASGKELKSGNIKKALDLYEETLKLNPAKVDAYFAASSIYRKLNQYERAAAVLERLKYLKPDNEMAFVHLGNIYFTSSLPGKKKLRLEKAAKNLNRALEINPKNFDTCYTLAKVYELLGKMDKSAEMENRARALESENK